MFLYKCQKHSFFFLLTIVSHFSLLKCVLIFIVIIDIVRDMLKRLWNLEGGYLVGWFLVGSKITIKQLENSRDSFSEI